MQIKRVSSLQENSIGLIFLKYTSLLNFLGKTSSEANLTCYRFITRGEVYFQIGGASDYELEGRQFESVRAYQLISLIFRLFLVFVF